MYIYTYIYIYIYIYNIIVPYSFLIHDVLSLN